MIVLNDPPIDDASDEITSATLLERTKVRDQAAWERMVGLYAPMVYRRCRAAGMQEADARDVGQEVFRTVTRKIRDFQHPGRPGAFRKWLRTITKNKIHDFYRRAAVQERARGGDEANVEFERLPVEPSLPEESTVGDVQRRHAGDAEPPPPRRQTFESIRGEFAPKTWQAFWQVVVQGRASADVAADLRMSVNSVYLAKSRVLRRLREEFASLSDEEKA